MPTIVACVCYLPALLAELGFSLNTHHCKYFKTLIHGKQFDLLLFFLLLRGMYVKTMWLDAVMCKVKLEHNLRILSQERNLG